MSAVKAFSGSVHQLLSDRGWRKRPGEIYTYDLGDYAGWLGLNRATKHVPVMVHPVVGVRHPIVEDLVLELMGGSPSRSVTPTISTPLRYLPGADHADIAFDDASDAHGAASQLVDLVEAAGSPFIREHLSEEALIEALRAGKAAQGAENRLVVLLGIVGRPSEARERVAAEIQARVGRTDAEAQQFRRFATAVNDWLQSRA